MADQINPEPQPSKIIQTLLAKGRREGFVTSDDVQKALPQGPRAQSLLKEIEAAFAQRYPILDDEALKRRTC